MRVANHKLNRAGAAQPISQHPLFPAIVALWFGALFGAASLALPPALVERLVSAIGIDKVVPMAAPPLGMTARILIVLGLMVIGAVIGAVIARRIGRPATFVRTPRTERSAEPEYLAEEALAEAPEPDAPRPVLTGRRRSLAISESTAPTEAKPEPQIFDVADLDLASFDAPDGDECLTMAPSQVLIEANLDAFETQAEPAGGSLFDAYARPISPAEKTEEAGFSPLVQAEPVEQATAYETEWQAPRTGAERIALAELDQLSNIELLERLAIAIERRRNEQDRPVAAPVAAPLVAPATAPVSAPIAEAAKEAITVAPEKSLAPAAPTVPPVPPLTLAPLALQPITFDNEDHADEPSDDPAPFTPEPFIPAALRPVSLDEDDEEELGGYIPPRHIGLAASQPDAAYWQSNKADEGEAYHSAGTTDEIDTFDEEEALDEGGESDVLDQGYSSLLNLSRTTTARQPVTRIEEDEEDDFTFDSTAAFAGAEASETPPFAPPLSPLASIGGPPPATPRLFDAPDQDPQDTEQALRAALATLQRMSGAA